jgi:hypothetical protein
MGSEWILGRLAWGVWIRFDWLRIGPVAGCCECGDEPSGSCATELVSYYTQRFQIQRRHLVRLCIPVFLNLSGIADHSP